MMQVGELLSIHTHNIVKAFPFHLNWEIMENGDYLSSDTSKSMEKAVFPSLDTLKITGEGVSCSI